MSPLTSPLPSPRTSTPPSLAKNLVFSSSTSCEDSDNAKEYTSSSEDEKHGFYEEDDDKTQLSLLRGPSSFKMTLNTCKWNESLVYWARPSLRDYFLGRSAHASEWMDVMDDFDIAMPAKPDKALNTVTRASVTIHRDGILLSILPEAPSIRMVVRAAEKSLKGEVMCELVGSSVACLQGTKILYNYAEYTAYGFRLLPSQRASMLWLLNTLNHTHVPLLRTFRVANFSQALDAERHFGKQRGGLLGALPEVVVKGGKVVL